MVWHNRRWSYIDDILRTFYFLAFDVFYPINKQMVNNYRNINVGQNYCRLSRNYCPKKSFYYSNQSIYLFRLTFMILHHYLNCISWKIYWKLKLSTKYRFLEMIFHFLVSILLSFQMPIFIDVPVINQSTNQNITW